jgi:hypothetical protein
MGLEVPVAVDSKVAFATSPKTRFMNVFPGFAEAGLQRKLSTFEVKT